MTAEGVFKPQTGRRFPYLRFGTEGAVSLHARSHHFHLLVVQIALPRADPVPRPFDRPCLKGNVKKESSSATGMLSKRLQ
jgi:hypothetical protein